MLTLFLCLLAVHGAGVGILVWGWRRAMHRAPAPINATGAPDAPAAPEAVEATEALPEDKLPALSVVVALRNEAERLPALLQALDQQTHPDVEVVLVDDASTDATADCLATWAAGRPNARIVPVTDPPTGPQAPRKKHALAQGIAAATHDLLAFTDADCMPPPGWLRALAQAHAATPGDTVVLGYSPMQAPAGRRGGVLAAFARYETFLAGTYAIAAAGLGHPYTAVGRNLSYPKSVFERIGGFDTSVMSGDDDLFVQAVRRHAAADVRALTDPASFVPTSAPTSWAEWIHRKRRHVSAGRAYDGRSSVALTLLNGAGVGLWLAPLALGTTGIGLLAIGLLLRQLLLGPAAEALDEERLLALFPLGEAAYALYHVLLVPFGLLRPPTSWSSPNAS